MTPNPLTDAPVTRRAGHHAEVSTPPARSHFGFWVLFLISVAYLSSLWVLIPLPFPYGTPVLLLIPLFLIQVPRRHVMHCLSKLGVEFTLLLVMILLSVLSLANSNAPFRSFRIIFPCALPFLIFAHLMVVRSVSRRWLLWIPRLLLVAGFIISVFPFVISHALPPLKSLLFETYRLKGFFEISIQHAIAIAVLVPLMVAEIVLRKRLAAKLILSVLALLLLYTSFRAGSKTAMSVGFLGGVLTYITLKIPRQSLARSFVMFFGVVATGCFLGLFGLTIAEKIEPETADKLRNIIKGGVSSYQSVQERRNLWQVAIEEGKTHWLVGSGAGESILSYPHAHNLILDYFRGIGFFGAAAMVLLCLLIFFRLSAKGFQVVRGRGDAFDARIFACYVAASVYVLCNQMSDCFGPSTIGFLWVIYLSGVLAERPESRRREPLPPGLPADQPRLPA